MPSELGLHRRCRKTASRKRKSGCFKSRYHLAAAKGAKLAPIRAAWASRFFFGNFGKVSAVIQVFDNGNSIVFGRNQNMRSGNLLTRCFISHKGIIGLLQGFIRHLFTHGNRQPCLGQNAFTSQFHCVLHEGIVGQFCSFTSFGGQFGIDNIGNYIAKIFLHGLVTIFRRQSFGSLHNLI